MCRRDDRQRTPSHDREKRLQFTDTNMAAVVLTEDAALRTTIEAPLRSDLRGSSNKT